MFLRNLSVALLLLVVSLFTIHNSASATTSFSDVSITDYFQYHVKYLVSENIINGYEEKGSTVFKPNQEVTRAEVAKMVVTAKKQTGMKETNTQFKDVSSKDWYAPYVYRAVQLGYMDGYNGSNTEFKPNAKVSRQEMAKILAIAFDLQPAQYEKYELPFSDVPHDDYYKYIAAIYFNGYGLGVSDTKFEPKAAVTRATFSVFMARGLNPQLTLNLPVPKEKASGTDSVKGQIQIILKQVWNVNSTPDFVFETANDLGTLERGTIVDYIEETEDYYKIEYEGYYGYIKKSHAKIVVNEHKNEEKPEIDLTPEQIELFGLNAVKYYGNPKIKFVGNQVYYKNYYPFTVAKEAPEQYVGLREAILKEMEKVNRSLGHNGIFLMDESLNALANDRVRQYNYIYEQFGLERANAAMKKHLNDFYPPPNFQVNFYNNGFCPVQVPFI